MPLFRTQVDVNRYHNNLESIQGGAENDAYHLTNAEHSNLTGSNPTFDGLTSTAPVIIPNYTVASLPSAVTWTYGVVLVTDATLTTITGLGLVPTGGGVNKVPVYSDGTDWRML